MKLQHLSWSDVDQIIAKFCQDFDQIIKEQKPIGIYGEPRGGLIPAIMLSHRLGLPWLQSRPRDQIYIWIDDIADKGNTIARSIIDEPGFPLRFVLVRKTYCPIQPVSGLEIAGEAWIVFPWEDPKKAKEDFDAYHAKHL